MMACYLQPITNNTIQNRIKIQAHEHPRFRSFAAKYGQSIHQLNMRLSVALLRNVEAEIRAKEKAEAPTVKTKEEIEREEEMRTKHGQTGPETRANRNLSLISVWKRKFRPLPEAKAVDLFADVAGDTFILLVAAVLILYEYHRSSQKPDANLERIKDVNARFDELERRERELEETEKQHHSRVLMLEEALRGFKDPKTNKPLLTLPPTFSPPPPMVSPSA
ncbi:optic atrophy 3 protein-domain-containing protein [Whalleya microplaca]|nr:optic atrophy 3 protein-domain-containing protein [Whalleya microplaca]